VVAGTTFKAEAWGVVTNFTRIVKEVVDIAAIREEIRAYIDLC